MFLDNRDMIKVDKRKRNHPKVRLVAFSKENMFALRKQFGLEQPEIADALGVSQGQISHYESGRATPTVKILAKLSVLLSKKAGYKIVFYIAPENEEAPPEFWGG